MKIKTIAAVAMALVVSPLAGHTALYDIDASHSSVSFKVRHMVVAKTRGQFDAFKGTINFEPGKMKKWKTQASIETGSINTQNEKRDAHLKAPDFFDAENYPEIAFESTKVKKKKGKLYLIGDLTMRGKTKEVELLLEYHGMVTGPWGNERIGFTATGSLNRFDYGISWSKSLDKGGLVVGKDIEITLEIEGIRRKKKG